MGRVSLSAKYPKNSRGIEIFVSLEAMKGTVMFDHKPCVKGFLNSSMNCFNCYVMHANTVMIYLQLEFDGIVTHMPKSVPGCRAAAFFLQRTSCRWTD